MIIVLLAPKPCSNYKGPYIRRMCESFKISFGEFEVLVVVGGTVDDMNFCITLKDPKLRKFWSIPDYGG